jgi:AAA+ superfamily predicted ATPase
MSLLHKGRTLAHELRRFFGRDLAGLPVVNHAFAPIDLPNVQIGIETYGQAHDAQLQTIGYTGSMMGVQDSLADLVGQQSLGMRLFMSARVGPVQYRMVDIDIDDQKPCVERGIYLIRTNDGKLAVHVRRDATFRRGNLELEVMSANERLAAAFLTEIRAHARLFNVYRGKILSLDCDGVSIHFHRFPKVRRDDIVLTEATMALLERNTVGFLQHAEILRRSGRSVKRGILLHGKPGTGKTFTAKWLGQSVENTTVILMSGEELWLIRQCCQLARMLAPALIIMEDVDLVASQRDEQRHPAYQITLHQMLNEMDGLDSDAEVIFLLTTNRPDAIEGAIAARPGRIDQAIEFPLPDAECRRRLLALYGKGLRIELANEDSLIARTEGASPAFIQELIRKAALIAAEQKSQQDDMLRLTDAHFDEALRELVLGGGKLTRNLLGFTADVTND